MLNGEAIDRLCIMHCASCIMKNPFEYGRPESFCSRQQELNDICRAMENGQIFGLKDWSPFIHEKFESSKKYILPRDNRGLPDPGPLCAVVVDPVERILKEKDGIIRYNCFYQAALLLGEG